jgi:hypothetical protein
MFYEVIWPEFNRLATYHVIVVDKDQGIRPVDWSPKYEKRPSGILTKIAPEFRGYVLIVFIGDVSRRILAGDRGGMIDPQLLRIYAKQAGDDNFAEVSQRWMFTEKYG